MISRHVAAEIEALSRRQTALSAASGPSASTPRLRSAQLEYDATYRALGTGGAPPPEPGEAEKSYRGRLVAGIVPFTATFKSVDPYAVACTPVEETLRAEVAGAVVDRHKGDPITGRLRKVEVTDPETGARRTEWRGDDTRQWMSMFSPPFQVAISEDPRPPVRRWGG